jgi:hypothetical protein
MFLVSCQIFLCKGLNQPTRCPLLVGGGKLQVCEWSNMEPVKEEQMCFLSDEFLN